MCVTLTPNFCNGPLRLVTDSLWLWHRDVYAYAPTLQAMNTFRSPRNQTSFSNVRNYVVTTELSNSRAAQLVNPCLMKCCHVPRVPRGIGILVIPHGGRGRSHVRGWDQSLTGVSWHWHWFPPSTKLSGHKRLKVNPWLAYLYPHNLAYNRPNIFDRCREIRI